jgi:hypothetical protein
MHLMSWIEKTDLPTPKHEHWTSTALSLRMAACVSLELDGRLEACTWVRCIQMQEEKNYLYSVVSCRLLKQSLADDSYYLTTFTALL